MSETFDPVIEAALIQAAATIAAEASAFSERNHRAISNIAGAHGLPIIEETGDRVDPVGIIAAAFGDALIEVRERYRHHLKHPRHGRSRPSEH